jgi:GNAT superfamily N-acetyltransferase
MADHDVRILPASVDRFDDIARLVGSDDPSVPACWCLSYRLSSSEFNRLRGSERPDRLRALCDRTPAPGLVAYLEDTAVGWCSFGPRPAMERLMRSQTIPRLDPPDTWCIVCFVVAPGARRRGVAQALLNATVAYARSHQAQAIEGYPIETNGQRVSGAFAYVGTVSMFERAGFHHLADTNARSAKLTRVIMRHDLKDT